MNIFTKKHNIKTFDLANILYLKQNCANHISKSIGKELFMSFSFFDKKGEKNSPWHILEKDIRPAYDADEIPSDVLGSYTGTAYDDPEPVQDADDL